MSFEKYINFFEQYDKGITVRPQNSAEFEFQLDVERNKKYKLFVVGDTNMFYMWKNEPDEPALYRLLTDALDTNNAYCDQYCLNLSCDSKKDYIKRIYKKVMWPPVLSYLNMANVPTLWQTGIFVKADGLKISENGFLRMKLFVRLNKEGVSRHSVEFPPDDTIIIDFPQGTYDWKELNKAINIPQNTANVGVIIEGKGYSGKVYVEHPFLSADSQNLLPQFSVPVTGKEKFEWNAQFLSRKEWPEFEIKLNGNVIFKDEVFERVHTCSEWEIELPKRYLRENNILSCKLISDYHEPLPYTFKEMGIIEQPDDDIAIIGCSEIGRANGNAYVLIRTNKPDLRVRIECLSENLFCDKELFFSEAGLHGISLQCKKPCENAEFVIFTDTTRIESKIPRIAFKNEDNVITGSGDLVYIMQNEECMEEYLSWYISNNVGNFLTIRPSYRWSGTRTLNSDCWKPFVRVLNELDIKYVIMMDGREIPGMNSQPDDGLLAGKGYLGRQNHEHDGAQFYWGQGMIRTLTEEQHADMIRFAYNEDPEHCRSFYNAANYIYKGETMYVNSDRSFPHDMKIAHQAVVKNLSAISNGENRHTGPSAMFKYLAEAGYSWLGAETMYSSMEPLLAFLRGYCKAYDKDSFGVHHALQWSTTPFDDIGHFDRYRLALFVSYMLGATDINTEEGLWHSEEYYSHYHRFSNACKMHLKQQQDFYRYISTHSRTGKFYTPFAFVHGRYDGTVMFCGNNAWGWGGLRQTFAEDSWHMLKTVYPLSKPQEPITCHGLTNANEPKGYYSGTPLGNADVIPAEAKAEAFSVYRLLIFLGYNMCEEADAEKYYNYVSNGGKVILTRAHLSHTTDYERIRNCDLEFKDSKMSFSCGKPHFVVDTKDGIELEVCNNSISSDEVLAFTDNGLPLVCKYKVGKGEIVLFNTKAFPAHKAICSLYEQCISDNISKCVEKESVWVKTGNDVGFSVWRQSDNSSHIYLLAVDWYNEKNSLRKAELRIENKKYIIEIPFGIFIKCVVNGENAAWALSENAEVISVADEQMMVQGTGIVDFVFAKAGKSKKITVDFTNEQIQKILVENIPSRDYVLLTNKS